MAVGRNVVGWIGEDHAGDLAIHECRDHLSFQCRTADEAVRAELPDVAGTNAGGNRILQDDIIVGVTRLLRNESLDQAVDLGDREAGDLDVKVEVDLRQRPKLLGQDLVVPAGI